MSSLERRGDTKCSSVSVMEPKLDATHVWDPGGVHTYKAHIYNAHIYNVIATAINQAAVMSSEASVPPTDEISESRTDLDSHANMPVIGSEAFVLADLGKSMQVSPYTPTYEPLTVPLVDAAVKYDCPYSGKAYILVIRNALHVPEMDHNLLPPFMLREAGIKLQDTPKIQLGQPTEEDHAITFPETGFRIPLSLWGTFSYFPTTKPSKEDLVDPTDVYLLTPTRWNPNTDAYARNEEAMLDWEGNVKQPMDRPIRVVIDDLPDDEVMVSSLCVSAAESAIVDTVLDPPDWIDDSLPTSVDEALLQRAEEGDFMMTIGASYATNHSPVLVSDSEDESVSEEEPEDDWDVLEEGLDEYMSAAVSSLSSGVTPEHLAKVWRISQEDARRTIENTSQFMVRPTDPTLSRNYGTNDRMLRYKRIHQHFFMDTFFASKKRGKSSRGHTCCQLFVTDKGFVYVVPMLRKGDVPLAMKQFAKEIGAPDAFVADMSGEQMSPAVKQFVTEIGSTLRALEEGTPWANKAELYIGLLKEAVRKDMRESNSPMVFWDYCVERRARIHNLTAKPRFSLHGSNPHNWTMPEEGDISNLCQYAWYDWCYFREQKAQFPDNKEVLGRVLGPARGEGNEMAQWVLKANGKVVSRRSCRPLSVAEIHSPVEIKKREVFDALIERRWGNSITPPKTDTGTTEKPEEEPDEETASGDLPDNEDVTDSTGKVLEQQPMWDSLINAEVLLQLDDNLTMGKVKGRSLDPHGNVTGSYNENPLLNSIIYDVEFPDGQVKEYAANILAENMLSQVDSDGHYRALLKGIVDHRKNPATAVPMEDKYLVTPSGQRRLRRTTQGWDLLVAWKDGTESWVKLSDLKESYPVELAEYAKSRGLQSEPAFAWWVPHTIRRRNVILSAVKSRMRKKTHKYGIEIPDSIQRAKELDAMNGNTLWMDALRKEMYNVGVAFEVLDEDAPAPKGWSKVDGHIIWDLKMDFTRKARWVLNGHKCPDPDGSTYAGVVSRESVRIALTYAALNGLAVCAADIRNAYLQAPSSQKHFIVCGPEFGYENEGKVALIHRALYGGKSAGRDFRNHLRSCMHHLQFQSCPADPDVWMRPAIKSDGTHVWEYVLLYTDDALVISENAESILRNEIGRYFELKKESIGPPKLYLGGHLSYVQLENGVWAWAYSSSQYVRAAVKNVEDWVSKQESKQFVFPSKAETPMSTSYRPELDVSPELGPTEAAYYQSLIGILRWIVELGRVDICLEVSMMSSHMALPRVGHLQQVLHIFAHLKKYHNTEIVYDPSDPVIDQSKYEAKDWASSEFGHVEGKEELPPKMPEPRGFGFTIRAKVDADHASDTVTRRSRTGFLVYLNCALVYWWSKKQTSVETSSFGSEFVAMKQCCEYLRGLRYKLRMMGIPVNGPCYIQGDNQSVLANTTEPGSTLKKKSQSIAYHFVREGVARHEWRTSYINTHDNEADLLTKMLPSGEKRKGFVMNLLHHIYRT